jgi:uncharacterized protein
MILETHLIPEGHSTKHFSSDLESVRDDLPPFSKKVDCLFEIDRSGATIFVHVWFTGEFNLDCARCLKKFPFAIKGDFRTVLKDESGKSGRSMDDDLVDFYFNDRNENVDLSPIIYEEILTTLPLMPLCSSDCKGIMVNDSNISIEYESVKKELVKEIDPRWDALRKLKKN